MPIAPDTKDWTWVLERRCPECGFAPGSVPFREVPDRLLANARAWSPVLARPDAAVRPDDSTWSPLEYACHVRDVHRIFTERLSLMLQQDDPAFANWDQDATAVEDNYGGQDPAVVAVELQAAAGTAAAAFAAVGEADLLRTGLRSDGSRFTVLSLARYYLHDPVHHLWDVTPVTALPI